MNEAEYITTIDDSNILTGVFFDLTAREYHGGTTFSSGTLPKWDVLGNRYMIKRCSVDDFGHCLTDAANEETVYLFCQAIGIDCAYYRTVQVKYFDTEIKKTLNCPATVTQIVPGTLTHYRVVRNQFSFGSVDDELLDFSARFSIFPQMNDMLFVDYIFNQQDRHSKNLGLIGERLAPIFDSGACLFYQTSDDMLPMLSRGETAVHKTFGRRLDALLDFTVRYVNQAFSFPFSEYELHQTVDRVLAKRQEAYTPARLEFIRNLLKERITHAGQILAQI